MPDREDHGSVIVERVDDEFRVTYDDPEKPTGQLPVAVGDSVVEALRRLADELEGDGGDD